MCADDAVTGVFGEQGDAEPSVDTPIHESDHRLDSMKQKAQELAEANCDRKYSFSKRILLVGLVGSFILAATCIYIKARYQMDVSDLLTITTASFASAGTYGGFYYWKEKNANRAKYAQQFVLLFADEYGVDAAIRISEVVLKD